MAPLPLSICLEQNKNIFGGEINEQNCALLINFFPRNIFVLAKFYCTFFDLHSYSVSWFHSSGLLHCRQYVQNENICGLLKYLTWHLVTRYSKDSQSGDLSLELSHCFEMSQQYGITATEVFVKTDSKWYNDLKLPLSKICHPTKSCKKFCLRILKWDPCAWKFFLLTPVLYIHGPLTNQHWSR